MKLYVLLQKVDGKLEFYRGNPEGKKWNSGKRRNIRVFPTLKLAESAKLQNNAGDDVIIEEFVPEDMDLRPDPYTWSWAELENHLKAFDHVEVNFMDGGEHKPFSGDSGVSVLRVVDVSPTKSANGKVHLHVSTNNNWFSKERNRIMSDSYIKKLIEDTVAELDFSGHTPYADAESALLKAFKIGVPPVGEPFIRSRDD